MTSKRILSLLTKLDLAAKEAEVYLACLQNGPISPTALSKLLEIKRPTLYLSITKLEELGLLGRQVSKRKKYLIATPPSALADLYQKKKQDLDRQSEILKSLIPTLQGISSRARKAESVQVLMGQGGILTLLEKILRSKKDFYWIGSMNTVLTAIEEKKFQKIFVWQRMGSAQKTTAYAITDRAVIKKPHFLEPIGNFRHTRFVNENFSMPALMVAFDDTVAFVTVRKNKTKIVLINDELISSFVIHTFKIFWRGLSPSLTN